MRQRILVFLVFALIAAPLQVFAAYSEQNAQSYLEAHGNNPWATMALASVHSSNIPSDYLKSINGTSAIDYAAPILAITALEQDPRTFGNMDLVAKLKSYHVSSQLGDSNTTNDDIFGLLALVSSGESTNDTVVAASKNFILNNQNSNGGWGFQVGGGSDSNMTAASIVALISSGVSANDAHIQNALTYLHTARNNDGGFTYDPTSQWGTDSDTSSTAWVLWALNSLGIDESTWEKEGNTPKEYLESNQAEAGYFKYQQGSSEDAFSTVTTAYAVIALAGKSLPIHTISSSAGQFDFRIEGKDATVCTGKAKGPSALDVVKNASNSCGYTYHIKDTSFGPYLDKINNDESAGLIGWIYLVNFGSPDVGAADYQLQPGDTVLWFYGDFNWKPSRLSVAQAAVDTNESTEATVEYFSNGMWTSLENANVLAGTNTLSTNVSGKVSLSLPNGFYKVFAEKTGYIRSNKVGITFGDGVSSGVSLVANVQKGEVLGDSISFTVNPGSVDFGTIKSGESSTRQVTIENTGQTHITITAQVSGDAVFVDNITVNAASWNSYALPLATGVEKQESIGLHIPPNYSGSTGTKLGQIVFWANAN